MNGFDVGLGFEFHHQPFDLSAGSPFQNAHLLISVMPTAKTRLSAVCFDRYSSNRTPPIYKLPFYSIEEVFNHVVVRTTPGHFQHTFSGDAQTWKLADLLPSTQAECYQHLRPTILFFNIRP